MSTNWTDLLPDGITRPIVIDLKFPVTWRRKDGKPTSDDQDSRGKAIALAKNPHSLDERASIAKQLGADHVTVLSNPADTTDPNVYATVHVPSPLKAKSADEAAQMVMTWFEGSLLGKVYFDHGRKAKMKGVITTGKVYDSLSSLKNLKPDAEDDAYTHQKAHCACH